jgi:hypothetical protein
VSKAQQLQRAAERTAALQDAAVADYEANLRRIWGLVRTSLRRVLRQWDAEDGRLVTTAQNLGRVLTLRETLRAAMQEAGYDDIALAAVDDPLDALASQVLRSSRIANQAARLSPVSLEAIGAWKELKLADLLDLAEDTARAVQSAALDGVLGLRPVDRLLDDVEAALDDSAARARTVYDTAVSTFTRQMEALASDGTSDELFLYVGPVDSKTRPFCLERVGRVYSRAQIDAMDNGSLPNVFITGGSYNCRHIWSRVSVLDAELRKLAETGERAPWVEAQAKRVRQERRAA